MDTAGERERSGAEGYLKSLHNEELSISQFVFTDFFLHMYTAINQHGNGKWTLWRYNCLLKTVIFHCYMLVCRRLIWNQKMIVSKSSCLSNFRVNHVKLQGGKRGGKMEDDFGWLWGGDSPDWQWCRFKLALFESGWFEVNLMSFGRIQFDIISCGLHYLFIECDIITLFRSKLRWVNIVFISNTYLNLTWSDTILFNLT